MKTGMLWYDSDIKSDLPGKIEKAAAYYQKKYGQKPDLCFVHPTMLKDAQQDLPGIQIRTTRHVLPNHLWLGVQEIPTAN